MKQVELSFNNASNNVLKRSTVKRMCIKSLPSTLVIQLKRFDYDWDAGRSLKFDDYFQVR